MNRRLALQFYWLRECLDAVYKASHGNYTEETLARGMALVEGHLAQWENFCTTGAIDPAASPMALPFLWGLENDGMLWFRHTTRWITMWQVAWVDRALRTSPSSLYFEQGRDGLVMGYWALLAVYRHAAFELRSDETLIANTQRMCARLAFMVDQLRAREHIPNPANPDRGLMHVQSWDKFPVFQREYIACLNAPDENDELETVSGPGVLAVVRAGLVHPRDWLRLSLCLGLNPPRVVLPLPPLRLLQAYRGLACFCEDMNPSDKAIVPLLHNLIARFEFLSKVPRKEIITPDRKTYYECQADWLESRYPFYFPIGDGDTFTAEAVCDSSGAVARNVLTAATTLPLARLGAPSWAKIALPLTLCTQCQNMFEALLLYFQCFGRSSGLDGVPPKQLSLSLEALGNGASERGAAAIEQTLQGITGCEGKISNFDVVSKIFVELCGPVCLSDSENCTLRLSGDQVLDLSAASVVERAAGGLFFRPMLVSPWENLWNAYRADGLVDGAFPETAGKSYSTIEAILDSAEMKALRRCVLILIYQSKAPIIMVSEGAILFSLAISNGPRHVCPNVYLPPDSEILARAVMAKLLNVSPRHSTMEEALAFWAHLLCDLPEVDTAAIQMIAEGFSRCKEWTRNPADALVYLRGYFDGRFSDEA
jgi:hypothetical protein